MSDYEKYQLLWMIDHGHSLRELLEELKEYQYEDPEDSDRISTPIPELFQEWEKDRGFDSEIWPCEAEFNETEAQLAENAASNSPCILISVYDRQISTEFFPTLEKAQKAMLFAVKECGVEDPSIGDSDESYEVTETSAWANHHGDNDWEIIAVPTGSGIDMYPTALSRVRKAKAERILVDNGIEAEEAGVVLQAIGYALLDIEMYPEPGARQESKTAHKQEYRLTLHYADLVGTYGVEHGFELHDDSEPLQLDREATEFAEGLACEVTDENFDHNIITLSVPEATVQRIQRDAVLTQQLYEPYTYGPYVLSPVPNAFNKKTSYWLSKKGLAVSHYCFSIDMATGAWEKELNYQLGSIESYIAMFRERFE